MKKLPVIICAAVMLASCKGKDNSLQTDKNIVVMTDTSRASGSYLSDTGLAKLPAPAPATAQVAVVPAVPTHATTQRTTTSTNKNGTVASTTSAPVGSTTTTTTTGRPAKKGWSSAAKDATIGGVGGAVVGAVVGKGKGAIIGGVLGAGGGYILGRSKDRKTGRVQ